MSEAEEIEQLAAWFLAFRYEIDLATALWLGASGFFTGYEGKPWRKTRSRTRWATMQARRFWEAGALAREMEGTR